MNTARVVEGEKVKGKRGHRLSQAWEMAAGQVGVQGGGAPS